MVMSAGASNIWPAKGAVISTWGSAGFTMIATCGETQQFSIESAAQQFSIESVAQQFQLSLWPLP